jgi:hypothetical protein
MGSACHHLRGYRLLPVLAELIRRRDLGDRLVLTLPRTLRLLKESGGDGNRAPLDRNGAPLLAREWLRAGEIFILAGEQVNPCYQNPLLPRHISIRHNLIEQLVETLAACNKNVKIEWC